MNGRPTASQATSKPAVDVSDRHSLPTSPISPTTSNTWTTCRTAATSPSHMPIGTSEDEARAATPAISSTTARRCGTTRDGHSGSLSWKSGRHGERAGADIPTSTAHTANTFRCCCRKWRNVDGLSATASTDSTTTGAGCSTRTEGSHLQDKSTVTTAPHSHTTQNTRKCRLSGHRRQRHLHSTSARTSQTTPSISPSPTRTPT